MKTNTYIHRWSRIAGIGFTLALGGTAVLGLASHVQAQGEAQVKQPEVKAELKAFRVTRVDGKEKLVSAETARPGEVIEYQVSYSNEGNAPAGDLKANLPVPDGMVYVANSATPNQIQASTDEKNFAPAPLTRVVKAADGTTKVVPVPLSEYRALRWNIGSLKPGAKVLVKSRMLVKSPQ